MNYILTNLKLVLSVAALSSLPSIYFAARAPTMAECRAEYAKESKAKEDEMASKIILGDSQKF